MNNVLLEDWDGNINVNLGDDLELVIPLAAIACIVDDGLDDITDEEVGIGEGGATDDYINFTNYVVEDPLESSLEMKQEQLHSLELVSRREKSAVHLCTIPQYMAAEIIQQVDKLSLPTYTCKHEQ